MVASGLPWSVSGFRFRARLGFSIPYFLSASVALLRFGYAAPHSSVGGTLTLMSYALLSTRRVVGGELARWPPSVAHCTDGFPVCSFPR